MLLYNLGRGPLDGAFDDFEGLERTGALGEVVQHGVFERQLQRCWLGASLKGGDIIFIKLMYV